MTPLFFSPVSNPLSQENGVDTTNSNGLSLDVVAGHRLGQTPRTPLLPTLNPQVSGSNPEGRTRWPRPRKAVQAYESLVVSYWEVVRLG
jgi:hypothetical protein